MIATKPRLLSLLMLELRKYSESQPRDERGRFASGGDSSPSPSSFDMRTGGTATEGSLEQPRYANHSALRIAWKAGRLDRGGDQEDWDREYRRQLGLMVHHGLITGRQYVAITSNHLGDHVDKPPDIYTQDAKPYQPPAGYRAEDRTSGGRTQATQEPQPEPQTTTGRPIASALRMPDIANVRPMSANTRAILDATFPVGSPEHTALLGFGDRIHIESAANGDANGDPNATTIRNMADFAKIPEGARAAVYAHGTDIYFGNGPVASLDDLQRLASVQPRGYNRGQTWLNAAGAHIGSENKLAIGDTVGHGSRSVTLHEFGHALDNALRFGGASQRPDFALAARGARSARLADGNPGFARGVPYYNQRDGAGNTELFAESFARSVLGAGRMGPQMDAYMDHVGRYGTTEGMPQISTGRGRAA